MALLPKIALVGHSYCRRLNKDIRDRNKVELKRNFDLSQCQVKFRWTGGWEVLDRDRFNGTLSLMLLLCKWGGGMMLTIQMRL